MNRYLRWRDEGYLSSNGRCFDIGGTALHRFECRGDPYAGSTDAHSAGNGSLMRLAPIPIAYAHDPARAIRYAADMSRTTHGAREAVDACRYYCALMVGALNGTSKEDLLTPMFSPVEGLWTQEPLAPAIAEVARGSFLENELPHATGAICGMLAGAVHGIKGIPPEWRQRVVKADLIEELAEKLAAV